MEQLLFANIQRRKPVTQEKRSVEK